MKKRAVSLIEVIISLGLLALLLSILFSWYSSLTRSKEELSQTKMPLLEKRYAHQRLQNIFNEPALPLFTAQNDRKSLVFTFNRGPYALPELSGKVLAKLYFDEEMEALALGLWPMPKQDNVLKEPHETIILLDRVQECKLSFYNPPDPFKMIVDPEEVGKSQAPTGWSKEWKSSYNSFPALLKIKIKRQNHREDSPALEYMIELPSTIIYPKT